MKTKFRLAVVMTAVAVILSAVGVGAWIYARPTDRVTLQVRNLDVRKVVRLLERQTGQTIVVQSNVTGAVTLNAKNLPLEKTLAIIGEQTFSRTRTIYPLYSNSQALVNLKSILSGESASSVGWTNLQGNGTPFKFAAGPRREEAMNGTTQTVSLNISFEELSFAALAFSRLTPARVVVEDGATNRVSLSLRNAPVTEAVAALAKKAGRKWTRLYVLSRGGPERGPGIAGTISDEEAVQREVLNDELLATLPPDEREKREQTEVERQKRFAEMKNMTPTERAQSRAQTPPPGGSQRMLERLKESTPEQRAAQRRQMAQRRAANLGGSGGAISSMTRN